MTQTASQNVANALGSVGGYCIPNTCLAVVGKWCGVNSGPPTAYGAWQLSQYKHAGDGNPPAGVPVYWSGGLGHVALSIGGGNIVSTDWPHSGVIGKTSIAELTRAWGKQYQGWTEDIEGRAIAAIGSAGAVNANLVPPGATGPGANGSLPFVDGITTTLNQIRDALSAIGKVVGWVSDSSNWLRVGLILVGIILIVLGVIESSKVTGALSSATKGLTNVVT